MSGESSLSLASLERPVLLDGAMGTILKCRGSAPPQVLGVHQEYARAGACILLTNTFRPDREDRARAAVALARRAAPEGVLVAGDIGPGGDYERRARVLIAAGVDLLVIETMMDIGDACGAIRMARLVAKGRPVIAMMTFTERGRTLEGDSAAAAARALAGAGADAVGANCSHGPAAMVPVIAEMRAAVDVPIAAKPSAGLPSLTGGRLTYPVDALAFGRWAVALADAGATFIGGCCGTTPAHIAAARRHLRHESSSPTDRW